MDYRNQPQEPLYRNIRWEWSQSEFQSVLSEWIVACHDIASISISLIWNCAIVKVFQWKNNGFCITRDTIIVQVWYLSMMALLIEPIFVSQDETVDICLQLKQFSYGWQYQTTVPCPLTHSRNIPTSKFTLWNSSSGIDVNGYDQPCQGNHGIDGPNELKVNQRNHTSAMLYRNVNSWRSWG
jgi:hypothetical protein